MAEARAQALIRQARERVGGADDFLALLERVERGATVEETVEPPLSAADAVHAKVAAAMAAKKATKRAEASFKKPRPTELSSHKPQLLAQQQLPAQQQLLAQQQQQQQQRQQQQQQPQSLAGPSQRLSPVGGSLHASPPGRRLNRQFTLSMSAAQMHALDAIDNPVDAAYRPEERPEWDDGSLRRAPPPEAVAISLSPRAAEVDTPVLEAQRRRRMEAAMHQQRTRRRGSALVAKEEERARLQHHSSSGHFADALSSQVQKVAHDRVQKVKSLAGNAVDGATRRVNRAIADVQSGLILDSALNAAASAVTNVQASALSVAATAADKAAELRGERWTMPSVSGAADAIKAATLENARGAVVATQAAAVRAANKVTHATLHALDT
jgi:hypothetical protein